MKFLGYLLIGALGLAALLGFGGYQYLKTWESQTMPITGEVLLDLKPNMPLRQLAARLEQQRLISSSQIFFYWMKINGDYAQFQAGRYRFTPELSPSGVSPIMLREKIKRGDVYKPVVLQVTIPEGFTLKMLNDRLAAKGVGTLSALKKLVVDRAFIQSLGLQAKSLEGYTYPATYSFETMPTAEQFYRQTVKVFFEKVAPSYEADVARTGLSLTDAVTFASLIEMETMRDEEKPLIAEVIWARLHHGEALGIDASIIYGVSDYDGTLHWKDLKNPNNPYNTRIHRGLPPTPIGAVSRASLDAVLNPTKLGYYYYVLSSTDQTRHVFSKTLSEHNALVRKLVNRPGK